MVTLGSLAQSFKIMPPPPHSNRPSRSNHLHLHPKHHEFLQFVPLLFSRGVPLKPISITEFRVFMTGSSHGLGHLLLLILKFPLYRYFLPFKLLSVLVWTSLGQFCWGLSVPFESGFPFPFPDWQFFSNYFFT